MKARAQLDGPPTDYDEACAGADRIRTIEREELSILVLPSQVRATLHTRTARPVRLLTRASQDRHRVQL